MFYTFPPEFGIFVAIIAVGWFIMQGVKSAASNMRSSTPKLEPVDIDCVRSSMGNCYIENYGYYAPLKRYVADIVCPKINYKGTIVAKSKEEFEKTIKLEFGYYEDLIRNTRNKEFIKKSTKHILFD